MIPYVYRGLDNGPVQETIIGQESASELLELKKAFKQK